MLYSLLCLILLFIKDRAHGNTQNCDHFEYSEEYEVIQTPRYPSPYGGLMFCRWTFHSPPGTIVALRFTVFDVDSTATARCDGDSIRYGHGYSLSPNAGSYCGSYVSDTGRLPHLLRSRSDGLTLALGTGLTPSGIGFQGNFWITKDCPSAVLDVAFLVDCVMTPDELVHVKKFIRRSLLGAPVDTGGVKVGILTYTDSHEIISLLPDLDSEEKLVSAINNLTCGFTATGMSNMRKAFQYARQVIFDEPNENGHGEDVAILITSHEHDADASDFAAEAQMLKDSGVKLRVVAVLNGNNNLNGATSTLVSDPAEINHFTATNYAALPNVVSEDFYPLCLGRKYTTQIVKPTGDLNYDTNITFTCTTNQLTLLDIEAYVWYSNRQPFLTTMENTITLTMNQSFGLQCGMSFYHDYTNSQYAPNLRLAYILVQYVETIEINASDINPYRGINVTLSCNATLFAGLDYEITYSWNIAGEAGNTTTIKAVSNGIFNCRASANAGATKISRTVLMTVKDLPVPIAIPERGEPYSNGSTLELTCAVPPHSLTITNYRWMIGIDSEYVQASDKYTIDIGQEPQNVSCSAFTAEGLTLVGDTATFSMSLLPKPEVVIINKPERFIVDDSYVLVCRSSLEGHIPGFMFQTTIEGSMYPPQNRTVTSNNITIVATEALTHYSCSLLFNVTESVRSDPVTVVGTGIRRISAEVSSSEPFPGTDVTFQCDVDLVTGYDVSDVTFTWVDVHGRTPPESGASVVDYVTPKMATLAYCIGSTGRVNVTSNAVIFTATELPGPTLTVAEEASDGFYRIAFRYTLSCNSSLSDILTGFVWRRDGQVFANDTDNEKLIEAMPATHSYTCAVMVNEMESLASTPVLIKTRTIDSVHIEMGGETVSILRPIFGSTLTLNCMATLKAGVTEEVGYKWIVHGVVAERSQDLTLTISMGHRSFISCKITVADDVMESQRVSVIGQESPSPPYIRVFQDRRALLSGESLVAGKPHSLQCVTENASENTTIVWMNESALLLCANEPILHISRASSEMHSGQYQCRVEVMGQAAVSRVNKIVVL